MMMGELRPGEAAWLQGLANLLHGERSDLDFIIA